MTDPADRSSLALELDHLLAAGALTGAHQKTGGRLLERLRSDICVLLCGPQIAMKDQLREVLVNFGLPQTTFQSVPWRSDIDFSKADVCIWCTASFGDEEAQQWKDSPDILKDHSFLVVVSGVSATDHFMGAAELATLQGIADQEFYRLCLVRFDDHAASLKSGSGATLVADVVNKVRMGAAADADHAQLFLQKHRLSPKANQLPPPVLTHAIATASAALSSCAAGDIADQDTPAAMALYQKTLANMDDHLADLEPLLKARDEAEFQKILSICEETSAAAADVFSSGNLQDSAFSQIRDELFSAADKILLMSLEGGVSPATNAVTTVLQLQREIHLQLARCDGSNFTQS